MGAQSEHRVASHTGDQGGLRQIDPSYGSHFGTEPSKNELPVEHDDFEVCHSRQGRW